LENNYYISKWSKNHIAQKRIISILREKMILFLHRDILNVRRVNRVEFTIAQHGRRCAGLKLFALSTTETRHSNVRSLISRDALSLAAKVRRALREKLASSTWAEKPLLASGGYQCFALQVYYIVFVFWRAMVRAAVTPRPEQQQFTKVTLDTRAARPFFS
jgi:hypothetical protein